MKAIYTLICLFLCTQVSFAAPSDDSLKKPLYTICTFESGEVGKIKYRGPSQEDARTKVAEVCLETRVSLYKKARGKAPTTDRKILFAEDCVNKTFCRR